MVGKSCSGEGGRGRRERERGRKRRGWIEMLVLTSPYPTGVGVVDVDDRPE